MKCGTCGFHTKKIKEHLAHYKTPEHMKYDPWWEICKAKVNGDHAGAERLIRKVLGVSQPMSEETKDKLKQHNEEHKDEIRARRKARVESLKRLRERTNSARPRRQGTS